MSTTTQITPGGKAIVVFSTDNEHWLAWFLHPRHKHCFVVVPGTAPGTSVQVDLTRDGIFMSAIGGDPQAHVTHYEGQGFDVISVPYTPSERNLMPTMINSCVALSKQLIGVRGWSLTPHQLYRQLLKQRGPTMARPRLNLTLPGFGAPTPKPPAPPAALPPPPTMADARQARARFSRYRATGAQAGVTNQGGAAGLDIPGSVNVALKQLTGS